MTTATPTMSPKTERELGELFSGGVFHNGLARVVRFLKNDGFTEDQAEAELETWAAEHRPDTQSHEIPDAVAFVYGSSGEARKDRSPRFPRAAIGEIRKLLAKPGNLNLALLAKLSDPIPPIEQQAREILPALFGPDEFVCLGMCVKTARTRRLSEIPLRVLGGYQFVVPNPARARWGTHATRGHASPRCRNNFPLEARRWLVFECDLRDKEGAALLNKDEQAAVIGNFARAGSPDSLPLGMVVDSCGKSLHAFFSLAGIPKEQLCRRVARFLTEACAFGADPAAWKPEQFFRVPGGTRYEDRGLVRGRQNVLFWKRSVLLAARNGEEGK